MIPVSFLALAPAAWSPVATIDGPPNRPAGVEVLRSERAYAAWWKKTGRGVRPAAPDFRIFSLVAVRPGPIDARATARVERVEVDGRTAIVRVAVVPGPKATAARRHPVLLIRMDRRPDRFRTVVRLAGATSDAYRVLGQVERLTEREPGVTLLDSQAALDRWFREEADGRAVPPKGVDWRTERVLAIASRPRPVPGYRLEVAGIDRAGNGVGTIRLRAIAPSGMSAQVIAYPVLLLAVPRDGATYAVRDGD